MGTLFEQLPRAQIRLKLTCAHHEANDKAIIMLSNENVQKSHLGTKLWAFEKKWVFLRVATFKPSL